MGKKKMKTATQLLKKVSYGEPHKAILKWQIRQATKDIFKNPLDVIGQNVENVIDECLIVRNLLWSAISSATTKN